LAAVARTTRHGATDEKNLPVTWSATENVAWRAPLGGVGVSSPIVSGDRVFVTSQIGTGVRRAGNHPRLAQGPAQSASGRSRPDRWAGRRSHVLRRRGLQPQRRQAAVAAPDGSDGTAARRPRQAQPGEPEPVTDGQMVYAWFGTGQIVALDMNGKVCWQRHSARKSRLRHQLGHASSPTLFGDTVLLLCDHAPASYLLAVDKKTGKERWRADRGKGRMSYTTPFVVESRPVPS
jgi:outer membrane protein assembly factor BamB